MEDIAWWSRALQVHQRAHAPVEGQSARVFLDVTAWIPGHDTRVIVRDTDCAIELAASGGACQWGLWQDCGACEVDMGELSVREDC